MNDPCLFEEESLLWCVSRIFLTRTQLLFRVQFVGHNVQPSGRWFIHFVGYNQVAGGHVIKSGGLLLFHSILQCIHIVVQSEGLKEIATIQIHPENIGGRGTEMTIDKPGSQQHNDDGNQEAKIENKLTAIGHLA